MAKRKQFTIMTSELSRHVAKVIDSVMVYKRATKYLSETFIVRAVRRCYRGKIRKRDNIEILLTIGKSNYAERQFIKLAKKAGEPFPIKKVQIKPYNG